MSSGACKDESEKRSGAAGRVRTLALIPTCLPASVTPTHHAPSTRPPPALPSVGGAANLGSAPAGDNAKSVLQHTTRYNSFFFWGLGACKYASEREVCLEATTHRDEALHHGRNARQREAKRLCRFCALGRPPTESCHCSVTFQRIDVNGTGRYFSSRSVACPHRPQCTTVGSVAGLWIPFTSANTRRPSKQTFRGMRWAFTGRQIVVRVSHGQLWRPSIHLSWSSSLDPASNESCTPIASVRATETTQS